jgi:hypothetical protein
MNIYFIFINFFNLLKINHKFPLILIFLIYLFHSFYKHNRLPLLLGYLNLLTIQEIKSFIIKKILIKM